MMISLITAVYNRAGTIGEALRSVQAQSHSSREHIVQDGGSDDATLAVINAMSDSYTRVESAPDSGIYDALNKGIARATGDVIGVLHSDDQFAHSDVLTRVAEAFMQHGVDGVYGDLEYVARNDTSRIIRYWKAGDYDVDLLRRGWMPPHPTLFLRKDVFDRFGAYDTSFRISADYDAVLRWLTQGKVQLRYIPEVLVKMRVGGVSNRSLGRIMQKSAEDYRALRRNGVGGFGVLAAKNLSKIPQFIRRISAPSDPS